MINKIAIKRKTSLFYNAQSCFQPEQWNDNESNLRLEKRALDYRNEKWFAWFDSIVRGQEGFSITATDNRVKNRNPKPSPTPDTFSKIQSQSCNWRANEEVKKDLENKINCGEEKKKSHIHLGPFAPRMDAQSTCSISVVGSINPKSTNTTITSARQVVLTKRVAADRERTIGWFLQRALWAEGGAHGSVTELNRALVSGTWWSFGMPARGAPVGPTKNRFNKRAKRRPGRCTATVYTLDILAPERRLLLRVRKRLPPRSFAPRFRGCWAIPGLAHLEKHYGVPTWNPTTLRRRCSNTYTISLLHIRVLKHDSSFCANLEYFLCFYLSLFWFSVLFVYQFVIALI